ncbi:MAG: STAS domain-containing protein, partial [Spirochaetia bacterium]|nr:STAS domain-containing protein [Spirochaetia bacterium]
MNVKKILRSRKNNLLTFQELEVFWHLDPSEDPSFIIVHFDGKMSERNTYELNQKFYKIIENCSINAMILNLSKLSYINSMGIA